MKQHSSNSTTPMQQQRGYPQMLGGKAVGAAAGDVTHEGGEGAGNLHSYISVPTFSRSPMPRARNATQKICQKSAKLNKLIMCSTLSGSSNLSILHLFAGGCILHLLLMLQVIRVVEVRNSSLS